MNSPVTPCEFALEVAHLIVMMEEVAVRATIRRENYAEIIASTCAILRDVMPDDIKTRSSELGNCDVNQNIIDI